MRTNSARSLPILLKKRIENMETQNRPTDKQREWLAKKGVPASEVSKMSFDDAKKKLDELFGKKPGSAPATQTEPITVLGNLDDLFKVSDRIMQHIRSAEEYGGLTEIGQMAVYKDLLNNYTKSKITEGISRNRRR